MKLEQITPISESYENQGCSSGLSSANGTMKAVWNSGKKRARGLSQPQQNTGLMSAPMEISRICLLCDLFFPKEQ